MFERDINKSILWDKGFQSYSFVIRWLISFVYLTYHFTNARTKLYISFISPPQNSAH